MRAIRYLGTALLLAACGPGDPPSGGRADDGGPEATPPAAFAVPGGLAGEDWREDTGGPDTGDTAEPVDADGDGFPEGEDCDDADATVYPGAPEVCGDAVVNDCDGDVNGARAACATTWSFGDQRAGLWLYGGGSSQALRIARVGDVNGDGLADVGIGGPLASPVSPTGGSRVDFAGAAVLSRGPDWSDSRGFSGNNVSANGSVESDHVGNDLVGVGDLDGDGYGDVIVGAPDSDGRLTDTPSAYLWAGPGDGGSFFLSSDAFVGAETNRGCLGSKVAPGPDGDGDGIADVLLGAECWGEVYLFSGDVSAAPEGGWTPGEDELARFYVPEEEVKGSSDDETLNELSRFGFRLVTADVNGDGVGDVVASAPFPSLYSGDDYPSLGVITIFFGPFPGGGAAVSYEDADQAVSGSWDSTDLFGSNTYPDLELGIGLSLADLDGDGALDLVGGAPYRMKEDGEDFAGAVFAWFDIGSRGDVDTGEADLVIDGMCIECERELRFGGELDAGGDFDGDGFADLVVAGGRLVMEGTSRSYEQSHDNAGWVFLGPFEAGSYQSDGADLIITGPDTSGDKLWAGQARFVGDVDGDGTDDILMADNGGSIGLFTIAAGGDIPGW